MAISDVIPGMEWMEKMGGPASLEHEEEDECRIFCVLWNQKTGKYRLTHSDLVIVDNKVTDGSYADVINEMLKIAKRVGEKITKDQIKV